MRIMKLCVALGLVLAVTGAVQAVGIPFRRAYEGPVIFDIWGYGQGTLYTGNLINGNPAPDGVYTPGQLETVQQTPNGDSAELNAGEDGWGVFRINAIYEGVYDPTENEMVQSNLNPLWATSDNGQELVGAYFGTTDLTIVISNNGTDTTIESSGDTYRIFLQPAGTFNDGVPLAADIRVGIYPNGPWVDKVDGIGYDSVGTPLVGATEVLTGISIPGFVPEVTNTAAERSLDFTYNASNNTARGDGVAYVDWIGGTDWVTNGGKFGIDSFYADRPADTLTGHELADAWLQWNNSSSAFTAPDMNVNFRDPVGTSVIPEPMTMFGVGGAVMGLLGYLRKRRA
jgi:hypothetical protein